MKEGEYTKIINDMVQAMVKAFAKNDDSDKTFKAKITEKSNDAKYKILYHGNTYTVSSSIVLQVNDMVWVCVPCNNWKELFVVCKTK